MTRRDLLIDAALALLACGLTLAVLLGDGMGTPSPGTRDVDLLGTCLVLASTLPLLARRRAPLTVYAVITAATLGLFALHYPADAPAGPLVAVYTLGAAYGGAPRPRRLTALAAIAGFVPAAAVAYAVGGVEVTQIFVPELLFLTLTFAGLWIAGDRAQLRRAHIADLERRARRAEDDAERDRRVAVAEERTRIARELHDSAGHAINVILMQAGAARLLRERDPDGSQAAIATIEQVARSTIGEIDHLVRALRDDDEAPVAPADPGAIEDLVEQHRAAGLPVTSDLRAADRPLPRNVAWATHRILQEALINAARHGGPDGAHVAVRRDDAAVDITVTNPYTGTGTEATRGGHGLAGMRERVSLLGGALEVNDGSGTFRVHARLPLSEGA